ncbi:MAG: monooxygenase [Pseudomonadota bacterium]
MSPTLLYIDFPFQGPWGPQLAAACEGLAADIASEPGLRWKLWTEAPDNGRAGGAYLFDRREDAQRYLDKHVPRLRAFGVMEADVRLCEVNAALSDITGGPLAASVRGKLPA